MSRIHWLIALVCLTLAPVAAASGPADAAGASSMLDLNAPAPPWADDPNTVVHSSPVVADLTGDGRPEVVVASRNGNVFVLETQGGLRVLPGWPQQLGAHLGSSPAVGDLDNDGVPEIVIGVGTAEDLQKGRQGEGRVVALRPDGTTKWSHKTANFWATGESQVFSTPAIGDLDGNGFADVVVASYNRFIYALDKDGSPLAGWPIEVVDTTWSSPALVDLNGNGRLSVVLGSDFGWNGTPNLGCVSPPTNGVILVIEADGRHRPGWPKCMPVPMWSSPAIVDLLGDGTPVAVFGTNNFSIICNQCSKVGQDRVYAYRLTDGQPVPGWPVQLSHGPDETSFSSPAVGDVDGDGTLEVAIGSAWGNPATRGSLYLLNRDGSIRWSKDLPYDTLGSPVLGDVDGDGRADVVVGNGDWNIYAYNGSGQSLERDEYFHTESFVKSSPVLADVDGDGLNEMIVASGVQLSPPRVYLVDTNGKSDEAANPWPMFRRDAGRTGNAMAPLPVVAVAPPAPPRFNFDEYILLANPGSAPANATVTLQLPSGPPITQPVVVPANSRVTVPIDPIVPNSEVSAKVDSDQPLAAERSMYFSYGPERWDGGHATHGAQEPATSWFLAEGYTAPNFDTYVLIQNPGTRDAVATVTLMKPGGETRDVVIDVPSESRTTLAAKSVPGFEASEMSFQVTATQPVVVERSMYFNYNGVTGGHDVVGVPSLSEEWFLAEGYTAERFDTFVLVANPGDVDTTVNFTFLRPDGPPVFASRDLPARSRGTLMVDEIPGLEATEVSTKVTAGVPIAVERAMYFDYKGKTGGHDAEGVTALASEWFLAEGYTGPGFDTYILLANPNPLDADTTLSFLMEGGQVRDHRVVVPANSRVTVHANSIVPDTGMSTRVTVADGVGIAVERAMYFEYAGIWDGGHDAQAVSSLSRTWYFAEGYTGT